jgi:outer membrane PBP1 activator LpoA protein
MKSIARKITPIALAGIVAGCLTGEKQEEKQTAIQKQPNILFIFIDDLGWTAFDY